MASLTFRDEVRDAGGLAGEPAVVVAAHDDKLPADADQCTGIEKFSAMSASDVASTAGRTRKDVAGPLIDSPRMRNRWDSFLARCRLR